MRTRFCATMRSPAASIMALIASVRLRRVASGLMIEKVRSIAISLFLLRGEPSEFSAYNGGVRGQQGSAMARQRDLDPSSGASRVLPQSPGIVSSPLQSRVAGEFSGGRPRIAAGAALEENARNRRVGCGPPETDLEEWEAGFPASRPPWQPQCCSWRWRHARR